jgi:hypothetical protein
MDDDGDRELNADVHSSAQAATVCLTAIGRLVVSIGTPAEPLFVEATGILEPVFACLIHPIYGTQIAAAWCLRCILLSVPILGSSLVDRCLNRLEYMKKSPEALNGCSFAISAILVELQGSITSVSYSKCQQVFSIAEQMLKTATQNTRLVQRKISSGWLLICSLTSLGTFLLIY